MKKKKFNQGAEAIIYSDIKDGEHVLIKERIKKNYRLNIIDLKLRKNRHRQEIKLIKEARGYGIFTPKIISSNENNFKIIFEKINGEIIKDFLNNNKNYEKICQKIGKEIGKLHLVGIIHGDLTTSNLIIRKSDIVFIDFGLGKFSNKVEDVATDLIVLLNSINATHNKISKKCWSNIIKGYKKTNPKYETIFQQMQKIENRFRYK